MHAIVGGGELCVVLLSSLICCPNTCVNCIRKHNNVPNILSSAMYNIIRQIHHIKILWICAAVLANAEVNTSKCMLIPRATVDAKHFYCSSVYFYIQWIPANVCLCSVKYYDSLWLWPQLDIRFNNCPTRWDLFNLLHFCRQLYMFWV